MSSSILNIEPRIENDVILQYWPKLIADEQFTRKFNALVKMINGSPKDAIINSHQSSLDGPNTTSLRPVEGYDKDEVILIIHFLFQLVKDYGGDVLKAWDEGADLKTSFLNRLPAVKNSRMIQTIVLATLVFEETYNLKEMSQIVGGIPEELEAIEKSLAELKPSKIFQFFHRHFVPRLRESQEKVKNLRLQNTDSIKAILANSQELSSFVKAGPHERSVQVTVSNLKTLLKSLPADEFLNVLMEADTLLASIVR
jgi:hypothetical protein